MYSKKNYSYVRTTPTGIQNATPLDVETELIIESAIAHGVEWRVIPDSDMLELSYNGKKQTFTERIPPTTSYGAMISCENKVWTRAFLADAKVPITKGYFITKNDSEETITSVFEALQKPLVVKITHGSHGDGVVVNVKDLEKYKETVKKLLTFSDHPQSGVLVEEMFFGNEYRILCTRDKVLGVINRDPANVIGDGKLTIKELIDKKNTDPMRNITPGLYPHIKLDEDMIAFLEDQGLTPDSIVEEGKKIRLRGVSNIKAGGDSIDFTDNIHKSVIDVVLKTVRAIPDLSWTGIDFMTTDITAEQTPDTYRIIEVNSAPDFAMHQIPMVGTPRDVATEFLFLLFPELNK